MRRFQRNRGNRSEASPLLNSDESDEEAKITKTMTKVDLGEDAITVSGSRADILSIRDKQNRWLWILLYPVRILFPSAIFVKLFLASIIPSLSQQLIPLFYAGQIPDSAGLAIAGQFVFINLILEVIQESITHSMFHFVGKKYKEDRICSLRCLKLCFLVLIVCGSFLTISILIFTENFVKFIQTPAEIVEKTKIFLWMSSFSFPLALLNTAFTNFFYITTSNLIVFEQIVLVIGTFCLNYFLFGQHDWSLRWGIGELGFYRVLQSLLDFLINICFLHWIERMSPKYFFWNVGLFKDLKRNMKALFSVSWGNCGDSLVRNFFYFLVTLKFMNTLGATEAGSWNLLNTVVYGVLLLPSFAVGNYVRVVVGHGADNPSIIKTLVKKVGKEAFCCLSAWMVIMYLLSHIFWPFLASWLSQSNEEIQKFSAIMFRDIGWVFVLYAFNTLFDSLFYGTGTTKYMFYQALGTNLVVNFVPWILYEIEVIQPSYWLVVGLSIAAQLVDMLFTAICVIRMWTQLPS